MSQIDEIKSKIDIVDLISEYAPLKQAGVNWKARCPFHNEKTPSFMVSREKQIYHCFGCGEGGDIFGFIQKIEGIDFSEALKILADKAGVKLERIDPHLISQKTKLLQICELAAKFYHQILLQSESAKSARIYLERRELSPRTINEFQIGYSPPAWENLVNFLKKRKFSEADIYLAGLTVKKQNSNRFYDRFRGRIIFPIWDANGSVVGFTARLLDENQPNAGGKYINTPQTPIYNKSLVIYGLDKAKRAIKEKDLAVVVEGQMDTIASHQAQINNVIASSGTAFTLNQIKLIQRYTNNLAIAFDMDSAGQAAAERGIDLALSQGMNIKVVRLPAEYNGKKIKDPDDCIKAAPALWEKAITQAVPIMDYYFDRIFNEIDFSTAQGKKKAGLKFLQQVAKLPDLIEQNAYLQKLSAKIDVPEILLRETLAKISSKPKDLSQPPAKAVIEKAPAKGRDYLLSEQLLALAVKFPDNLPYIISHFIADLIVDKDLSSFYNELVLYYNGNKSFNYDQFKLLLSTKEPKLANLLEALSLFADKDFFDFNTQAVEKEIIDLIANLQKVFLNKKINQLQNQLAQAEKNNDLAGIQKLVQEISQLTLNINK